MAKPTNLLAAYLRELPLTNEQRVQVYMLHIASKAGDGWFAAVRPYTIAEQLGIDSVREVEAAIAAGGWTAGTGKVGRQNARGYYAGTGEVQQERRPKQGYDERKAQLVKGGVHEVSGVQGAGDARVDHEDEGRSAAHPVQAQEDGAGLPPRDEGLREDVDRPRAGSVDRDRGWHAEGGGAADADGQKERFVRMLEAGNNYITIARELGVNQATAMGWLLEYERGARA